MNTQCPECHTKFLVTQEHLDAAGGKVRCGQCNNVFNALEYLLDKETEIPEAEPPTITEPEDNTTDTLDHELEEQLDELEFNPDIDSSDEQDTEEAITANDTTDSDTTDSKTTDNDTKERSLQYPLEDEFFTRDESIHEFEADAFTELGEEEDQEKSELDDLPEILKANIQEVDTKGNIIWNTIWSTGVLLAIGILVLQYAYFSRAELVTNPNLRPWIIKMCESFHCNIPLKKDPTAIQLISRDLLIHPRNKKILLINASMVNTAKEPQPYPLIEIRLSNSRNEIVAMRRFKPEEYLQPSSDIGSGMQPQTPVNFKLETIRPAKEASTFQFDFH